MRDQEISVREFAILFQQIFGPERWVRFVSELRDEAYQGPVKSEGSYPIRLLRTAPEDGKVAHLDKKRATHGRSQRD